MGPIRNFQTVSPRLYGKDRLPCPPAAPGRSNREDALFTEVPSSVEFSEVRIAPVQHLYTYPAEIGGLPVLFGHLLFPQNTRRS
jgi:hypothetical protein